MNGDRRARLLARIDAIAASVAASGVLWQFCIAPHPLYAGKLINRNHEG
jgi:hypothetical protein